MRAKRLMSLIAVTLFTVLPWTMRAPCRLAAPPCPMGSHHAACSCCTGTHRHRRKCPEHPTVLAEASNTAPSLPPPRAVAAALVPPAPELRAPGARIREWDRNLHSPPDYAPPRREAASGLSPPLA